MKPYSEYSAEELAMERLFIRWIMSPDDLPIRKFWMGWIAKYPHMQEVVQDAKELVRTASDWNLEQVSAQESGSLWNRIRTTLETLPEREHLNPLMTDTVPPRYFLRWSVGIATTVMLVLFWFLREPVLSPIHSSEGTSLAKSDTTHQYNSRLDSISRTTHLKIK